jgi:hypothetical protein
MVKNDHLFYFLHIETSENKNLTNTKLTVKNRKENKTLKLR